MAGNMIGSDLGDMQDLIGKLAQAIDQIQGAMGSVDGKVNSVVWRGPDADRFRSSEWPNTKSQLTRVISDLTTVKETVQRQRSEQESTSNA